MSRSIVSLTLVFVALGAGAPRASADVPTVRSNLETVTIRDGSRPEDSDWILTPDAKPDVYNSGSA